MIFIISAIVTRRCGLLLKDLEMRVYGIWVWSFGVYWSEGLPLSVLVLFWSVWCLHIQGLRFCEQVTDNHLLHGRSDSRQ